MFAVDEKYSRAGVLLPVFCTCIMSVGASFGVIDRKIIYIVTQKITAELLRVKTTT